MTEVTANGAKTESGSIIIKSLLLVAIPIIIGNLLEAVTEIVDMHFIGSLGTVAMAGAAAAMSVSMLLMMLLLGVAIAIAAYISRAHGMGDSEHVASILTHALILGLIISAVIAVIGIFFTGPIMNFMTHGLVETAAEGASWLQPILIGTFLIMLLFVFTVAFQAIGQPMVPMFVLLGVNVVNAILNPVLIGIFGLPGSAYATLIARGLGAVALLVLMYTLPSSKAAGLRLAKKFKFNGKLFGEMTLVAAPSSIQGCIRNLGLMIMTAVVGLYMVNEYTAAYGVCTRTDMLGLMVSMGLAQAVCVLVGQNLGAGNVGRASRTVKYAAILTAILMAIVAVIFVTAGPAILGFFGAKGEVLSVGLVWMSIIPLASILMGTAFTFGFAMNGAGLTWPGMIGAVAGQIIVPVGIGLIAVSFGLPIAVLFVGVAIGIVVNFIIDYAFYKSGMWKRRTLKIE